VIDQGVQARSDIAGNDPGILVELLVMADAYLYRLLLSRAIDLNSDQLEPRRDLHRGLQRRSPLTGGVGDRWAA